MDTPVPPALQAKVEALHCKVLQGHSVNRHIREAKTFRNPDLLEKLVQIFGVDQRGTNFAPSILDPHNLPAHLFYGELEEARSRWAQRQAEERAASGRVTFVPAAAERPELPVAPPAPAAAAATTAAAAKPRRSKWDTASEAAAPPAPGTEVSGGAAGGAAAERKRELGAAGEDDADKRPRLG